MPENNSLGDKFAGFTSEPDPKIWENIERSLDEKPRRRIFAWWWTALAATVVVGIIVWGLQDESGAKSTKSVAQKGSSKSSTKSLEKPLAKPGSSGSAAETQFTEARNIQNENIQDEVSQRNLQAGLNSPNLEKVEFQLNESSWKQGNISFPDNSTSKQEINSAGGLKTELTALENLSSDSLENLDDAGQRGELLSEKDSPKEDDLENEIIADSSVVAKQEVDLNIEKNDTRNYRWQLQFQIGTLASGKQEMIIPSSLNIPPSLDNNENTVNNGVYTMPAGNASVIKPYRNITANYSFLASYNACNRWRLTTGFSYLRFYMYTLDDRTLFSGAHFVQIPIVADFKLIDKSKWEWSVGTGIGFGYVFEKKSTTQFSTWRSDFIAQTSLQYALNERFSLQFQPQARFVCWDQQIGKIDKLSPWYWGGNIGGIWHF